MKRPFYHYLMTERDPNKKDAVTIFANSAENDGSFPKQSEDYDEISAYLELNGSYLPSMDVFDEAWTRYIDRNAD
ncbi:YozE family protein [Marinilactibacillus kalidii]|uniref:YozE family protein n=1 Tax=Marinilactibacillus kalidii TaxID=2820274 RepID=UPI001ABE2169|nr:YozE family protein [Marinilactibacillus kalidii]